MKEESINDVIDLLISIVDRCMDKKKQRIIQDKLIENNSCIH